MTSFGWVPVLTKSLLLRVMHNQGPELVLYFSYCWEPSASISRFHVLCWPREVELRIDMLGRNMFAVGILKDSSEVGLAVARTWMLHFAKILFSLV